MTTTNHCRTDTDKISLPLLMYCLIHNEIWWPQAVFSSRGKANSNCPILGYMYVNTVVLLLVCVSTKVAQRFWNNWHFVILIIIINRF